ncbi:hypothetical protein [Xenorhabdus sp. PB62.4]|uniref:hypothetical protein n=1 Tax=Xenorhabdus sp. PB62.4 TaxID=1851573 RepID=UPI001656D179|nr:hypothetical protein [Xenorhabdus sp. PB62.4]
MSLSRRPLLNSIEVRAKPSGIQKLYRTTRDDGGYYDKLVRNYASTLALAFVII